MAAAHPGTDPGPHRPPRDRSPAGTHNTGAGRRRGARRRQRRGGCVAGTSPVTPDDVAREQERARRLITQLGRVVLGQPDAVRDLVIALAARGHVLLEGVPGTAKTLLVRA